jgi:hypothetical protein
MYIRTKVAKGKSYYQIVEGRREGGKVRQRVLCSLGPDNDPAGVLERRRLQLAQHRRELAHLDRIHPPGDASEPALVARRRAQLRRWIGGLPRDIAAITRFIEQGNVGTTGPARRDTP